MLAMVFAIPTVFGLLVWNSFRKNRGQRGTEAEFAPEGKLRWEGRPEETR